MTSEIKTLAEFKHFASYHFKILKPAKNIYAGHKLEVRVSGYANMVGLACNLIKMCTYASPSDGHYITDLIKDPHIDISSVLEFALQLVPHTELEVLDEIHQLLIDDSENQQKDFAEK